MGKGWTPERRARQATLIRTWRPWEHSTGPCSAEGKTQAARNAQRFHGWTPELLAVRAELKAVSKTAKAVFREQGEVLAQVRRVSVSVVGRG